MVEKKKKKKSHEAPPGLFPRRLRGSLGTQLTSQLSLSPPSPRRSKKEHNARKPDRESVMVEMQETKWLRSTGFRFFPRGLRDMVMVFHSSGMHSIVELPCK